MRSSGSVLFFAALSLALHLAWVLVVPESDQQIQPATHWVEVSFEEQPAASLQEELPSPSPSQTEPDPVVAPSLPRKKEKLAKAAEPRPQMELAPQQPVATEPSAPSEPSEPSQLAAAEPLLVKPVEPLAILPRSAALSLDPFAQPSALRCGARALTGQSDCPASAGETEKTAQAALTRDLDAAAHSVAHLKAREHAKLKRRSDGSYKYEGGVFQAIVRPDGNVEFRDTAIEGEIRISPVPFVYTADLNDLVEKHVLGRELYSAEKMWLLEETRELRDQLASESRRREQQGANRELERTLRSVLDDGKLTLDKKHEAIFLLWQDCGEDGQAAGHRQAVDRFVRRYMPKGSSSGFLADELEHFNASRGRLQKFQPYAGG